MEKLIDEFLKIESNSGAVSGYDSGFNTIVLTENELIKRRLNPQYYEIVRDYVSEMEYEQWTQ